MDEGVTGGELPIAGCGRSDRGDVGLDKDARLFCHILVTMHGIKSHAYFAFFL